MIQTIEQQRAYFAYTQVNQWVGNRNVASKLKTLIPKVPTMILQNGLGQTIVFIMAEGSDASKLIINLIQDWIAPSENEGDRPCKVYNNSNDELITKLVNGSRNDYMRAQEEILALFNWVKKFVDTKIDD